MPAKQFKWWLVTSWIDTESGSEPMFAHPSELLVEHGHIIEYGKGQQECCPETLRMHWQWICHTKKKITGTAMAEILGPDSWAIGMTKNNADEYVHKDETKVEGTEFEFGQRPFHSNEAADWQAQLELFRAKRYKDMHPGVFVRHARSFNYAASLLVEPYAGPKEVNVFQGLPGTGKSRRVWEIECGPDCWDTTKLYVVTDKYWWDGYSGQEAVLFEEYMGQWDIAWFLRVCDRYPMQVPVKGGFVGLAAKRIYFTSNVLWEEWYNIGQGGVNGDHIEAIRRRLTNVVDF